MKPKINLTLSALIIVLMLSASYKKPVINVEWLAKEI